MPTPLVSIVTPSYNQGQFIGATLDSILSQDYPNLELIVMDGGSTDNTVDVLKTYTDPRLSWVSERDNGQTHAINKGLARAKGEILAYLNSDDVYMPNMIAFSVDYLEKHPDIGAVYGDNYLIDAEGNTLSLRRSFPFPQSLKEVRISQPSLFWRKSVTDKIGLFDERFHYTMDTEYWWRMAINGFQLAYVEGGRAGYRLHGTSKTVSQEKGFIRDHHLLYEIIYSQKNLPQYLLDIKPHMEEYILWKETKQQWLAGEYTQARPLLRKFLTGTKNSRRILAVTMLIDSYLKTPITNTIDNLYFRSTGAHFVK